LRPTPATQRATQFATTAIAAESTPTQISCSSAFRMWWKDVAQWGGPVVKQKLESHRQQPTVSSTMRQQPGEWGGCWMQQAYKESTVVFTSTIIFPSWRLPVSSTSCVTFCALHIWNNTNILGWQQTLHLENNPHSNFNSTLNLNS